MTAHSDEAVDPLVSDISSVMLSDVLTDVTELSSVSVVSEVLSDTELSVVTSDSETVSLVSVSPVSPVSSVKVSLLSQTVVTSVSRSVEALLLR